MKTINFLYAISLVILAAAIYMVDGYPANNRVQAIAGALTLVGFVLNIVTYVFKRRGLA